MKMNFATLKLWLLCGTVVLFFTVLLDVENFPCSCHLSQDSENITDNLTAPCTLPKSPERCVFRKCRTWFFYWKYKDNVLWPLCVYRYHQSFPVLSEHIIWNLQFKFSKLNQQIWIKMSYNKKGILIYWKEICVHKRNNEITGNFKDEFEADNDWLVLIGGGKFIPSWRGNSTGRKSLKHLFITEQSSLWGSAKWIKISFLSLNILN